MAHHFLNIQNSFPPFRKGGKTAFFCHSSYEPRCMASINTSEGCQGIDSVFIFHSHNFLESKAYQNNHSQIVRHFGSVSHSDPVQIPVESSVKDKSLDTYKHLITEAITQADDIAFDISTFNSGIMIYLLDLIMREKGSKPLYLFYSEPEKYGTEKNGKTAAWLTKGVKDIISVPGFFGEKQEQRQSLLVLLLGCDAERAISTIEEVNPDKIVVISQGTLKCRKGLQEIYLKSHGQILERYADKIATILTVPPKGWEAVYDVFSRVYALYRNQYNLTALLQGTKMQVFGAVTFCQKHPSIELLYMQPEKYNSGAYTHGVGQTWWLDVPDMNLFKKR
jgi:hypothetical protein